MVLNAGSTTAILFGKRWTLSTPLPFISELVISEHKFVYLTSEGFNASVSMVRCRWFLLDYRTGQSHVGWCPVLALPDSLYLGIL